MNLEDSSKEDLIEELTKLHRRVADLESTLRELEERKEVCGDTQGQSRSEPSTDASKLSDHDEKVQQEVAHRTLLESELTQREREERFRQVFEQGPLGMAIVDLDYRWISVNSKLCEMVGYAQDELTKLTVIDITHPDDIEADLDQHKKVLQGEIPLKKMEKRYIKKNGEVLWIRLTGSLVRDDQGNATYFLAMIEDITDHKQAVDSLRNLSDFRQTLIDSIPNPVFYKDETGKYIDCNEAFALLVGMSREDVVGKSVYEVAPKGLPEVWQDKDQELFNNPHVQVYECTMAGPDGRERSLVFHKAPLFDANGTIIALIGIILDITERKEAEDALRESQQKYRMIFEHAPLGILHFDHNGVILDFNDKFLEMVGAPREKLVGFNMPERQEDEQMRQAVLDALGGKRSYYEGDYLSVTGRKLTPMRALYSPVLSDDGTLLGGVGIFEDITKRKVMEQALKESEDQYRTLVEESFDGVFIQKDFKIIFANSRLCEMLGYSLKELENLDYWTIYHGDYRKLTRDRATARMRGEDIISRYEVVFQRKDGTCFDGELSARVVQVKGEPGVLVWVRDISERKRSEESQRLLATAVAQAAEAIVVTNAAGNIQYVNPAFEAVTGYTRTQVVGQNPRILKSGEHDSLFYKNLWDTVTRGEVWKGRFTNKRKDGSLYYEESTISPVKDHNGQVVNFVAVKRDITQNLQLSQQLLQAQKMEAIGTLAGGIAHDFNNLLQVALGYSEMLLAEKEEDDPEYADISRIFYAAKSGAELVQRLLTFSRKVESKQFPLSLNRQIVQVEKLLRRTIPKMIDLRMDLSADLAEVNADPTQIEQVLMNLAVNARDAMPDKGTLTIRTTNITLDEEFCRIHAEAKPGRYVMLTLSDTGHGMDRATIEHIFEPFYTTKELGRGTGLGLAMVYGIVQQHAGYITCESEVGRGTTFAIYLPAIESFLDVELEKTGVMPAFGTETILLVDDEEFVRDLGQRILSKAGYEVLAAANGKDALDVLEKERSQISLVILDLIMPDMGGEECLRELRKIDPGLKVLIASGLSPDTSMLESPELGAKGFVGKPFRIKELLRQVRKVLDERGLA